MLPAYYRTIFARLRNWSSFASDAAKRIVAPLRDAKRRTRILALGRSAAASRGQPNCAGEECYLCVMRFDNIGDYVVFRNFLPLLKEAAAERGLKLMLAGNSIWRELAEGLDLGVVDRFEWFDIKLQNAKAPTLAKELARFAALPVQELFIPNAGRTDVLDAFAIASAAKTVSVLEKVRTRGHGIERFETQVQLSAELGKTIRFTPYPPADRGFEFDLVRQHVQHSFGKQLNSASHHIEWAKLPLAARNACTRHELVPRKYLVIFPGASRANRKWPLENFAAVADAWAQKHRLPVVICGGPGDKKCATKIATLVSPGTRIVDLTGATTLTELAAVIGQAALLVSNDTGAIHFAASTELPFVVVSRGSAFDHFLPYPETSGVVHEAVFTHSFERLLKRRPRASLYRWDGRTWLGEISPERVIAAVCRLAPIAFKRPPPQ